MRKPEELRPKELRPTKKGYMERQEKEKLFKQKQQKQVLDFARDFEEAEKSSAGYQNLMHIISVWKQVDEEKLSDYRLASELEKLQEDNRKFMVEKATLEARIGILGQILNASANYKEGAKKILNKTSENPTPGSNSGVSKEER